MESLGVTKLDHVAVAVWKVNECLPFLTRLFDMKEAGRFRSEEEHYAGVTLDVPGGNTQWEVMEPTADDSFLTRFLEERGPGLHHVTFQIEDVEKAAETLRAYGIEPFGEVRVGSTWKELFIHPRDAGGVLIQLYEGYWASQAPSEGS
jgi:methylmalonyl-CoA/ethylmalonyl-CoA epimerase